MKKFKNLVNNFFNWLSKTELVELDTVDINEGSYKTRIRQ